jgi:hypothetical protein
MPGDRRERALRIERGGQSHLAVLAADGDGTVVLIIPLADRTTAPQVAR